MTKNSLHGITFFFAMLLLVACSASHEGKEEQLEQDVDSFATAYFNWHFHDALAYSTPTSEMWLHYAASNVHQADVDTLRNMKEGASHEIEEIAFSDSGDSATVSLKVKNFLRMDTIGTAGHLVEEAMFSLPAVYSNGRWKIDLRSFPKQQKR